MSDNLDIKAIVAGCAKGNRRCQEALYKSFYGKMMVICLRYTNNKDEAKDILQESFIKVFSNIPGFDFTGSFDGWMKRIFVNTAIDYYRKNKTESGMIDNNVEVDDLKELHEDMDGADFNINSIRTPDILEAVQELTPVYRAVFNMYAIDGFTHQQIAKELNISQGTSKSNYSKAKNNLKKILMKKLIICDET